MSETQENKTGKAGVLRRSDIILIAAALIAASIIGLAFKLNSKPGTYAEVRINGEVIADFPLDKAASYLIENDEGGTNLLIIEDGKARVEEASCPDGICVQAGKLSMTGQSAVCLPNRVIVEIVEKSSADAVSVPQ
ncbi:MAG: NusG domain II-containing protein [Eubacteriales bacterium]|nr:NusG domain II-containing protein [Eubacteriales bacterium]